MRSHTVTDIVGHADVQGDSFSVKEAVNTSGQRQILKIRSGNVLGQPGFTFTALEHALHDSFGSFRLHHLMKQCNSRRTISHRSMPRIVGNPQVSAYPSQAVTPVPREQLPRHAHSAQFGAFPDSSHRFKMAANKGVVKSNVVRNKNGISQPIFQFVGNGFEGGRRCNHGVVDSCQLGNVLRNGEPGVNEGFPTIQFTETVGNNHCYFGDAVASGMGACGFDVDNGKAFHDVQISLNLRAICEPGPQRIYVARRLR